jgi:hypothetical protein
MECHRCPHREAVENGKYAVGSFRQTPCARCILEDVSARTLEADEERPVFAVGSEEGVEAPEPVAPEPEEETADMMPVEVLAEFAGRLLELPQDVRDVVCMRFLGMSYRKIGRRQGLTTAGAEARHERGMRLFPPLRALFARKMVKRGLRRKPGEGSAKGG